jgi:hypothetical protein
MSEGAILSMAFFRSSSAPLSYSMVVIAPVDPEQKAVTVPFLILDFSTMALTDGVMSMISLNPFVLKEMISERTMNDLPVFILIPPSNPLAEPFPGGI